MATLFRLASQGCRLISANKACLQAKLPIRPSVCSISTSKKNKDATAVSTGDIPETSLTGKEESLVEKEENWISFGYCYTDREYDEWSHHLLMFSGITIALCGIAFFHAYHPDYKMRDWTQREAYLELARREREGLPLIDHNIIDPSKVDLPSDEELGDTEIII